MNLQRRLDRLVRNLPAPAIDPEQCPKLYIGALVVDDAPVPPDAPRCKTCGGLHVVREFLTIVDPVGDTADTSY
jgi:hypothetical protein